MKTEQTLKFSKGYTVTGSLKDGKGNEFLVYVSGSKKEVDKFIRYQRDKYKKTGVPGINVIVEPYKAVKQKQPRKTKSTSRLVNEEPFVMVKGGKVKIGISRSKIVTPRPYKIKYVIDPPVHLNNEFVGTDTKVVASDFEFEFDSGRADVDLNVHTGKVQFSLFEAGVTDPVATSILIGPKIDKLEAIAKGTIQKWRIEAKGLSIFNLFDVAFTKVFR